MKKTILAMALLALSLNAESKECTITWDASKSLDIKEYLVYEVGKSDPISSTDKLEYLLGECYVAEFKVSAKNKFGAESVKSVGARIPDQDKPEQVSIKVIINESTGINECVMSWESADGATGYTVYKNNDIERSLGDLNYSIPSCENGSYSVSANNKFGIESPKSKLVIIDNPRPPTMIRFKITGVIEIQ